MTMKFGVLLFLLCVAQDVSSSPFLPIPGKGDCSYSRAPYCRFFLKEVGCYKDNHHDRVLPDLILTARDPGSSKYFGKSIEWEDWSTFIDKFACACAEEAKKRHYDYIGIEFYGECWAGKNKDFKHGPSENCVRVKKDECKFESCIGKPYGLRKCVGGALALFVYKVYQIPLPPVLAPKTPSPPPPQATPPK